MENKAFERTLIVLGIIGLAVLLFASVANAAGTVCQIGNGCTGTSTSPNFGQVLVGNSIGTYNLTATSSLGFPAGGSGTVTSVGLSSPNSTLTPGGTNPVTTSGTISADINLASSNQWTASTTFTKVVNLSNASTSIETAGLIYNTGITSALGLFNSNHQQTAFGGSNCSTHQYAISISAVGAFTCAQISLTTDVTGTLPIANGGTNQTSFTGTNAIVNFDGTHLSAPSSSYTLSSSLLAAPNASTTNLSAGSSNYMVNPLNEFPIYIASSTWGTGTTTITLMNNSRPVTWVDARCGTSAGTLETRLYTGTTNNIQYWSSSTTQNTLTFTTNNVLSTATTTFLDIGNAASSPTNANCTLEYTYNGSS
jgi:hypothetical protein